MSASESDGENEIFGLAEDNDYLDFLNFDSPELQEFYNFYDLSKRVCSPEERVFSRDKLQELHKIFYPKGINAYQRYSHEIQSIQQVLRDASRPEWEGDDSLLEPLRARINDLKQKMGELIPCLHELKNDLETRFKTDQHFRSLLNEWKNSPRALRHMQELEAPPRAPSGPYATFQSFQGDPPSLETEPPSSPRAR